MITFLAVYLLADQSAGIVSVGVLTWGLDQVGAEKGEERHKSGFQSVLGLNKKNDTWAPRTGGPRGEQLRCW